MREIGGDHGGADCTLLHYHSIRVVACPRSSSSLNRIVGLAECSDLVCIADQCKLVIAVGT